MLFWLFAIELFFKSLVVATNFRGFQKSFFETFFHNFEPIC